MDYQTKTPWHSKTIKEVFKELETSEEGLSDSEAENRLKNFGENELHKKKKRTILQMIWYQLKDPMILILFGAAILSFILQEPIEGSVIFLIVAVNTIVSIFQEKKAEASLDALKSLTTTNTVALRQGEESIIPASQLVVGDVVILEAGNIVPADIRLIDSYSMKIQESSLTGESVPSEKDADDILDEKCSLGDRSTMAYSSTFVTYGRAIRYCCFNRNEY